MEDKSFPIEEFEKAHDDWEKSKLEELIKLDIDFYEGKNSMRYLCSSLIKDSPEKINLLASMNINIREILHRNLKVYDGYLSMFTKEKDNTGINILLSMSVDIGHLCTKLFIDEYFFDYLREKKCRNIKGQSGRSFE
jgi:hypothetical protein